MLGTPHACLIGAERCLQSDVMPDSRLQVNGTRSINPPWPAPAPSPPSPPPVPNLVLATGEITATPSTPPSNGSRPARSGRAAKKLCLTANTSSACDPRGGLVPTPCTATLAACMYQNGLDFDSDHDLISESESDFDRFLRLSRNLCHPTRVACHALLSPLFFRLFRVFSAADWYPLSDGVAGCHGWVGGSSGTGAASQQWRVTGGGQIESNLTSAAEPATQICLDAAHGATGQEVYTQWCVRTDTAPYPVGQTWRWSTQGDLW